MVKGLKDKKIVTLIGVSKKYKINRPLRSDAWYKYQVYQPYDKLADDLGYVHFPDKRTMMEYTDAMKPVEQIVDIPATFPTNLHWFLLGALSFGLLVIIERALV